MNASVDSALSQIRSQFIAPASSGDFETQANAITDAVSILETALASAEVGNGNVNLQISDAYAERDAAIQARDIAVAERDTLRLALISISEKFDNLNANIDAAQAQ